MPWDLEPLEGFGSSLSGARLDPAGAMSHSLLRAELKEQRESVGLGVAERAGTELIPQLHGVPEAQHPRRSIVLGGSLSHQQAHRRRNCTLQYWRTPRRPRLRRKNSP